MAKTLLGTFGGGNTGLKKTNVYSDGSTSSADSGSSSSNSTSSNNKSSNRSSNKSGGGSSTKALKDMTVAEAAAAGKTAEYNALVNNIVSSTGGIVPKDSSGNYTSSTTPTVKTTTPATTTVGAQTSIKSSYSGPSIIDYLDSAGQPSDITSRAKLAKSLGLAYDEKATGNISAAQNTALLNALRSGKTSTVTDASAPITSQDYLTQQQTEEAIVQGILPEQGEEKPVLTKNQKYYMEKMGLSEEDVLTLSSSLEGRERIASAVMAMQDKERADEEYKDAAEARKASLLSKTQMEQASADTEYGIMIDKVNREAQGALEQAKAVLYASNPYAATGLGADNAQQVVKDWSKRSIDQSTTLYNQAKALRNAGYEMEANDVDARLNEFMANSRNELSATLNDLAKTSMQAKQFEVSARNTAQDNFRQNMTALNYTPEAIDSMVEDGSIVNDMTFRSGIEANIDAYNNDPVGTARSVINTMRTGSIAKQKADQAAENASDLSSYRDAQLALAIERLRNTKSPQAPTIVTTDGKAKGFYEMAKTLATNMSDSARTDFLTDFSDYIQNGEYKYAINRIRGQIYAKMPAAKQTSVDLIKNADGEITGAINYIKDNKSSGTGPWKSLAESLKPWVELSRDKSYADLRNKIELAQAPIRKNLYGTAVTGTELKNAERFLIQNSDTLDIIEMKLKNLQEFNDFAHMNAYLGYLGLDKKSAEEYGINFDIKGSTSTPSTNSGTTSSGVSYTIEQ